MVEHRAVAPGVAGSSPVDLPRYYGGGKFRGRLTGRTWDFDSQNRGSNPRPGIFFAKLGGVAERSKALAC